MTRGGEQVEVPVAPRMEISDGWALRTAALEDAGIAQLPAFVVGEDLRQGRLVAVLADWSAGVVPLHAVCPDNRLVAERLRAFVGFLARRAWGTPGL